MIGSSWAGDTVCEIFGIQNHGGIPDELRRGSTGCLGDQLRTDDDSYSYQMTAVSRLIFHAEAVRRHANNELFEHRLANGEPAILQSVLFVIDNPNGRSFAWEDGVQGVLRVAGNYYQDERLCRELDGARSLAEGSYLPFTQVMDTGFCSESR